MSPKEARNYLSSVRIEGHGRVDFIELGSGRTITFANMTDDDALLAAELVAEMMADIEKRKGNVQ